MFETCRTNIRSGYWTLCLEKQKKNKKTKQKGKKKERKKKETNKSYIVDQYLWSIHTLWQVLVIVHFRDKSHNSGMPLQKRRIIKTFFFIIIRVTERTAGCFA